MIKDFNLKFSIELRWPITFRKNDEEYQSSPPKESNILFTHEDVTISSLWDTVPVDTTATIETISDKAHTSRKARASKRGVNYFKTIKLKHDGISEKEIAEQLNISQPRVSQLWNEYIKSTPTHQTMYSKQALEKTSKPVQKKITTEYDKEFITETLKKILVKRSDGTPWIELHKEFNVPSSTLRGWVKRYATNR